MSLKLRLEEQLEALRESLNDALMEFDREEDQGRQTYLKGALIARLQRQIEFVERMLNAPVEALV